MNIIWKKSDKSIAITSINSQIIDELVSKALEDEIITKKENFDIQTACKNFAKDMVKAGNVPDDWKAVGFNIDVPKTKYFDALEWDAKSKNITINKAKASEIIKNNIRKLREPILKQLDIDVIIALENGESTQKIVDKKKSLRDYTNKITPDMEISDMEQLLEEFRKNT